jgi:predicted transcriptional regulator
MRGPMAKKQKGNGLKTSNRSQMALIILDILVLIDTKQKRKPARVLA